jgi:hypothetical protein
MEIGKIATPPARDSNFFSQLHRVIEQQHCASSLACLYGTHHPGRTCTYNSHVFLEFRHFTSILGDSGANAREEISSRSTMTGQAGVEDEVDSHQSYRFNHR